MEGGKDAFWVKKLDIQGSRLSINQGAWAKELGIFVPTVMRCEKDSIEAIQMNPNVAVDQLPEQLRGSRRTILSRLTLMKQTGIKNGLSPAEICIGRYK